MNLVLDAQSLNSSFFATSFQGNPRAFSNPLIKNFSPGVTWCNYFPFWIHFLSERYIGASPIQIPWTHLWIRLLVGTAVCLCITLSPNAVDSCKLVQKHAKVRFSCRSSPEISSRSTQRGISSQEPKRHSIYNWNPGPRRGKEGASEMQIEGKWHVITLLEAIEFVDHEVLTNWSHVMHYGRCAVFFNKDFYFEIEVKFHYFHDTGRELLEKDQGWILQGVLSRAFFSKTTPQRPEHSQFCPCILAMSTPTNGVLRKSSSSQFVPWCLVNTSIWLQAMSTGQRGGAAVESTSVPLKKPLRTELCLCRLALHHCGDPDRFKVAGPAGAGSWSRTSPTSTGKLDFTALSPTHTRL